MPQRLISLDTETTGLSPDKGDRLVEIGCVALDGRLIRTSEDNQLQLQASSSEVGEGSDMVEVAYDGEPFEVSFNPAYLADPLRNCDADTVRMKINDPLNPVAIEGGEGFLYVIMPIRKK